LDGPAGANGANGGLTALSISAAGPGIYNGDFSNGLFGWRQSGGGNANVTNVNTQGFNNAASMASGPTTFSLSQSMDTDINGTVGIGFWYRWTSTTGELVVMLGNQVLGTLDAPATLPTDFTFQFFFLQSDSSEALNQGVADLQFELLDPPEPAGIEITAVEVDATPAPEAGSLVVMGAGVVGMLMRRRRRG
jgi:hypothetical protein